MICKTAGAAVRWRAALLVFLTLWVAHLAMAAAWAQETTPEPAPAGAIHTAPVIIDGETLFSLRGVSAYPAESRAAMVREGILSAAKNPSIAVADVRVVESAEHSEIYAGQTRLFSLFDEDAKLEALQRPLLASIYREAIVTAIQNYREDRSSPTLLRNLGFALAVTAVLLLVLWGLRWLFRKLDDWIERNVKRSVQQLASKAHYLIHAGTVWRLIAGVIKLLRTAVYLLLVYFYLNTVLGLFPWTRPAARILLNLVLDPLLSMWKGFVAELPSLAFLVILWIVVRYLLKVIRAFFTGVDSGRIKLENFDADWAAPTYRIVRILVIAFAVIIAYPYIPGSDSAAFKGISVFLGVLLSLGSSSFIANLIAGLTMTYRGAFREGDLVRIGDTMGRVEDVKLMITRLRTIRNESVILPNSNVLNTEVINYSQIRNTDGLIVSSTVGIGYDTPWRQVEAMLLEAASRTDGVKSEPAPFVYQEALGDFAVPYQLNAYWDGKTPFPKLRSDLHANIQDVFNENGVQIMSPAYEADPETPKIVPPDKWYEAPAKKPDS